MFVYAAFFYVKIYPLSILNNLTKKRLNLHLEIVARTLVRDALSNSHGLKFVLQFLKIIYFKTSTLGIENK